MSNFVDQCRAEWKRLGVPEPLAEEMAEDLASDLSEAEAEGLSAEEFLGSSIAVPSSFAASWADERGIIPIPPSQGNARHRPFALVAFTAIAAITVIASALMLASGEPKLSLVASTTTPAGNSRAVVHSASAADPIEWVSLTFAIAALGFAAWLWAKSGRSQQSPAPT